MGCVFSMVLVSLLLYADIGPNDYRENAPHFIQVKTSSSLNWSITRTLNLHGSKLVYRQILMFPVSRCSSKIYFQTLNIIEEKLENDPILDLNRKDSDLLTGLFSWFSHSWTRRSLYRFFNENHMHCIAFTVFEGYDDPFYNLLKFIFWKTFWKSLQTFGAKVFADSRGKSLQTLEVITIQILIIQSLVVGISGDSHTPWEKKILIAWRTVIEYT